MVSSRSEKKKKKKKKTVKFAIENGSDCKLTKLNFGLGFTCSQVNDSIIIVLIIIKKHEFNRALSLWWNVIILIYTYYLIYNLINILQGSITLSLSNILQRCNSP